jgi:altronate dehydratase/ABC-type transport system involved in multi-copper enzyme maturation permease subunit
MFLVDNPVLQRELLSNLRTNRAFVLLLVYQIALALVIVIAYPRETRIDLSVESAAASRLVDFFFIGQFAIASLMAPSFAAGAITGEKERKTYEMLLASPLRPWSIVLGKLIAALTHLVVLIISSLPIIMLCLPLGGVSIYELLAAYVGLLFSILLFGSISVFCSSYFKRTSSSLVVSYVIILPLLILGVLGWTMLASRADIRLIAITTLVPTVSIVVSGMLLSVAANRLLYPPDIGSQGNEVVDLENEQKKAVGLVKALLPQVNAMQRTSVPASEIVLATKCGGSDGYSGITANPALGVASDLLVAHGGTSILSETTELYGAEQLFTKRAASVEVARKLLDKLVWWRDYTAHYGEDIDNNPSLGNKAGGLTTIVEKSLGAAVKGGQTALQDVIEYAEQTTKRGLVIMDAPGFDPVCVTGMVSGGANVVVFTTGRGSCFGCKPVPSLKVATNTSLFERMNDDMDLDMGTILQGESIELAGERLFDAILDTASGKKTKSELLGYGEDEFTPWAIGPTL